MQMLDNGAIATGEQGSWMRLQAAYEHELVTQNVFSKEDGNIPMYARFVLTAVMDGTGNIGPVLASAARACGIQPTYSALRTYLTAASRTR